MIKSIVPERKYTLMLNKTEIQTILGSLHDSRCELEDNMADPKTSNENYSDMATELENCVSLHRKLLQFLAFLKYGGNWKW